jgi:flagellar hook-associated protein 2
MASSASVSGMISGLDTATIIKQLMQVEAAPQTLLKSKLTTAQSTVTSLQSLNARFAALATKAADLAKATAWSPLAAGSTPSTVTVNASATAVPGTLSFTVQQTATAHRVSLRDSVSATDVLTSQGTGTRSVRLDRLDGTTVDIPVGDGTLAAVVNGINSAKAGVSASSIKLDGGTYRLHVVATTTGRESDFTLTNTDGSDLLGGLTATSGQDAEITVGTDTVHSATNTFTGLSQGLDVTLPSGMAAGTAVDVVVTRDSAAAQQALQGLVDSANEILTSIDKLSSYDAASKSSGPLAGDPSVRALRTKVLDAVTRAADGGTMADLGVQTDRYGKITFDTTKFATAFTADPALLSSKLGGAATSAVPGFAARLAAVATTASDSARGVLTTNIQNRQSSVTTMQKSIEDWDTRLEVREATLSRTFAALEVSLSKLQNQSSWLAGQVNNLASSSSSS